MFRALYASHLEANIFGFEKTWVELRVTVVDRQRKVLYDSTGRQEGADHSRWHNVGVAMAGI